MPVGFGSSDLMQFYLGLWLSSGMTLSKLGEWERENPLEYEAYMTAYVRLKKEETEAYKEMTVK